MARTSVRIRRRRLAVFVGAPLLVLTLWGPAAGALNGGAARDPAPQRYVVRAGDTVWSIAQAQVGSEADPRPLVDAIAELNGVDGTAIVPGQALDIPASA
ncbi:MAG: LysM peptidoglycan-binding domain-containing protein [Actinomycetota bacterium]